MLFVCTGNTCRSPMAEHICRALSQKMGFEEGFLEIGSAGTLAQIGAPMADTAQLALNELLIPYTPHAARQLSPAMAASADLILALGGWHAEQAVSLCPQAKAYTHTLKGYAAGVPGIPQNSGYDIPDPYGRPLHVYLAVAEEITVALKPILERLRHGYAPGEQ